MKTLTLLAISFLLTSCATSQNDEHFAKGVEMTPIPFLAEIFTGEHNEFSVAINPVNPNMILFTRRIGDGKQKIYETYYRNKQWTEPKIASFSTDRDEIALFTPNGKTVYFGSERPIPGRPNKGNFDMNIWKTEWNNENWSEPVPLPPHINKVQAEGEEWPLHNLSYFYTVDGSQFYTGSLVKGAKGMDIFTTTLTDGEFTPLEPLPATVNTEEFWEYAPILSPDGNYLFTQVYQRDDGLGGDDIYVSKKDENGNWLPSKNLGPLVNSKQNECPAGFSPDGSYFLFFAPSNKNSIDPDAKGRPYIIKTAALQLDTLFK